MTHEMIMGILTASNGFFALAAQQLFTRLRRISKENEVMASYIDSFNAAYDEASAEARRESYERSKDMLNNPPPVPTNHKVDIDHTTYLLMHLATNNTNEAEAKSAAMQVCMRIMRPRTLLLKDSNEIPVR